MGHMKHCWIGDPHLRCPHLKDKGWRMMCVCYARVRWIMNDNEQFESVTVGLMMEERLKDIISLNVVRNTLLSSSGSVTFSDEVIICYYDITHENGILCDSICPHKMMLIRNENYMEFICERISQSFSGNCNDFGDS